MHTRRILPLALLLAVAALPASAAALTLPTLTIRGAAEVGQSIRVTTNKGKLLSVRWLRCFTPTCGTTRATGWSNPYRLRPIDAQGLVRAVAVVAVGGKRPYRVRLKSDPIGPVRSENRNPGRSFDTAFALGSTNDIFTTNGNGKTVATWRITMGPAEDKVPAAAARTYIPSGHRLVRIRARIENTASVPQAFRMYSLGVEFYGIGNNGQIYGVGGNDSADDGVDLNEIAPGTTREGWLYFTAPSAAQLPFGRLVATPSVVSYQWPQWYWKLT